MRWSAPKVLRASPLGGELAGRHHLRQTPRVRLLLPDLFALVIRLLRDPRIDASLKRQLIGASAYVIAPVDFIPDIFLPIGLTDDTIALAFILSRVVAVLGTAGEDLLHEHWEGDGDVLHQIERLSAGANKVLNTWIVRRLGRRFGLGGGKKTD